MATIDTPLQTDSVVDRDAAFYASRRTASWQCRALSPSLQLLLWSLRLYVILMLVVVAIELARILK